MVRVGSVAPPPYPFYLTPEKFYLHGMHCESTKTAPSSSTTNITFSPGGSLVFVPEVEEPPDEPPPGLVGGVSCANGTGLGGGLPEVPGLGFCATTMD